MSWTIVAALSCVLVLAFVIPMLNDSGLLRNLVYRGAELCRPVRAPGLEGPEDIQIINGIAFISADNRDWGDCGLPEEECLKAQQEQGGLWLWPVDGSVPPSRLRLHGYTHPNFHPHGLYVAPGPRPYTLLVLVVNHRYDGKVVSVFVWNDEDPGGIQHITDVSHTLFKNPNDVAVAGPDGFYVTNWITAKHGTIAQAIEVFGRRAINYVTYCTLPGGLASGADGATANCRIVASGIAMPNGVALSPDRSIVYVTEVLTRRFHVYAAAPDGSLSLIKRLSTVSMCDNIDVDAESGDVFMGCHPNGLKFTAHAKDKTHATLAPSEVLWGRAADVASAAEGSDPFIPLLTDDGSALPGSSVAGYAGAGRVLVGGVFSRHFLACDFGPVMTAAAVNARPPASVPDSDL